MKKIIIAVFALLAINTFSALPQSITLESGNIRIRLDGRKFWNMNRIEWKNHLFGVDEAGAHYGITYQPKGSKYFIGSGHGESGTTEKFISLEIFADGKKITPEQGKIIKGKKIKINKISEITDLSVKTQTVIENDIIFEIAEISAAKDIHINYLYFFMHPWSTRFDKFHAVFTNGKKLDITLKSSNTFPNRKFVPLAAWYDTKSGLGVATCIKNIKGKKAPMRFLWDRTNYRKDYLCDYAKSTFKKGNSVVYQSQTAFFLQPDKNKWKNTAEKFFKACITQKKQ